MTKSNTFHACCIALAISVFGSITQGCLPQGATNTDQYNTENYSPNTDGSGLAGTWILTLNNEVNDEQPHAGLYERKLVRFAPVAGTADTYEFTACAAGLEIARSTVVAAGNTVSVSIDGTTYEYSATSDGRMAAPIYYGNDHVRGTWRAVRLSSDPQFDTGTVGLDFVTDNTGTIKQPTVCFSEAFNEVPAMDGFNPSDYWLNAIGASATGATRLELTDYPIGNTWIIAFDDAGGEIYGPPLGNTNTLKSTVQGIKGTLITEGDFDQTAAGSIVLDVRL